MNLEQIKTIQNQLTTEQKIRYFNGDGNWQTYTANGKIPKLVMSDGPHGLRKQSDENYRDLNKSKRATCFPTASCIASSWDPDLAGQMGAAIATEALAENVNLVLGPGMNIKRSPLCGRNFEYFSEDPYLTAKLATAYVNSMQQKGVGACVKHFACNNQETRRQTSSSNVDINTLHKIYLRAFEYVIKNAKPAAVMCSYNRLNGTYTCHNNYLLTTVLRDQWNFEGAVISDWGACLDAAACLKAGMDLAMPDSKGYFDRQLKAAIEKGTISQADLDKANARVLKMSLALNKGGESLPLSPAADAASATPSSGATVTSHEPRNAPVDFDQQHAIALKLAQQSAVLLKNNDFLPLAAGPVFVIGELAEKMKFQGGGSSHITTAAYDNAIESLKKTGFEVTYEPGYYSGFCKRSKAKKKNEPYIKTCVENLKTTLQKNPEIPVLFFCGLTESFEGEGFDRKDLQLPPEQLELLEQVLTLTDSIAIVSFSGAPVDLQPALKAKAILHMYLCGQACGEAVASLVSGLVNPCGKLAETWPLKVQDTPCFGNFALAGDEVNYTEGELVGYRWYNAKQIPVLFEFGYGLSYTSFEVNGSGKNKIEIDDSVFKNKNDSVPFVCVKVKNTGTRSGAEVVQLYYRGELCGFKKVFLEPGQEKEVHIDVELYELPEAVINSEFKNKGDRVNCSKDDTKGFTLTSSLGDMSKESLRIKLFLKIIKIALVIMNKMPAEAPSVRIAIAAIEENPVESLISTSGGIISEKLARTFVKWANK